MRPVLILCALWYFLLASLLIATAHNLPSTATAAALALCAATLIRASIVWNSDRERALNSARRSCWAILAFCGMFTAVWAASVISAHSYSMLYAARANGTLLSLGAAASPALLVLLASLLSRQHRKKHALGPSR
ncbi:hypothetical protein [Streptomyces sp. NPDC057580]|uniref:hypothetical protein n=1 Tax=Streptomyces sp. NPDC057580 TaxID=3346173 RepID=UPI00368E7064